jgi:hypothetical protein
MHQVLGFLGAGIGVLLQVEANPWYLGSALTAYRDVHGLDASKLAAYLEVPATRMVMLAQALRPRPGSRFEHEIRQVVTRHHCSEAALRALVVEAETLPPARPADAGLSQGTATSEVSRLRLGSDGNCNVRVAHFPERIAVQPEEMERRALQLWPGFFRQEGTALIFTVANGSAVYQLTGETHSRGWVAQRISSELHEQSEQPS